MEIKKTHEVKQGDLALYTRQKEVCLILEINPILGSGFQSVEVLWSNTGKVETVMIQYLKLLQK